MGSECQIYSTSMINIKTGSRQRLYPAKSCAKGGQAMQIGRGLAAQISPAIGVNRLAVDVARGRTAQKQDGRRDVFRLAALTGNGPVDQMVRRFRRVPRARRADNAGHDAIDGNAVGG